MNDEERWFKNTSGLDAQGLCKAYAESDKPFVEMGKYGERIEAAVWEKRMPDLTPAEQLAVELDRFIYDYDTTLYHDNTRNMTENVSELAESINQGDTSHLTTS